jgi:hypothetical protein
VIIVGRFNVRSGDGVSDWLVWDKAMNGHRGRGLSQVEAAQVVAVHFRDHESSRLPEA